jgi:hypothetical protein
VGEAVFVNVIGPAVAVDDTVALNWVDETWTTLDAEAPLNFTSELLLKPTPVTVTTVPFGPLAGLNPVIDNVTVKFDALAPVPAAVVTETLPVTAPFGTVALISVPETNVTVVVALVPNLTVAPGTKPVPVMVTELPVIPEIGVNELTVGAPYA